MNVKVKRVKCKFCGAKPNEPCVDIYEKTPLPFYHHARQVAAAKVENKGMHD